MSQPKSDNGASLVIDALLTRMSELDRYSDDETEICNDELLPFDVVIDENSNFGIVNQSSDFGLDDKGGKLWGVTLTGTSFTLIANGLPRHVRTIYETEATLARACLTEYFGGKACC